VYTWGQQERGAILSRPSPFGEQFLTKEWPFLCAWVSRRADADRQRTRLGTAIDWNVLLELAEEHSVHGILAKRLEEADIAQVPRESREKLQARIRAQHVFTLSLTAELFRVLEDFQRAGIQTMVIKGPVTALVAHGDPAMRCFGDVDLLLRQRDIPQASCRMQEQGFAADVPDAAIQAGKIPGEYVFRRPGTGLMVEIHTERTFRYYPAGMPIEDLFRRKRMLRIEGREVAALSLADEIVFHCVHGSKDFWERLLWISDVDGVVTLHPEIDWLGTWRLAAETGSERMLAVAISLAARVLQTALPTAIEKEIRNDRATGRLCRQIEAWLPYGAGAPPSLLHRARYRISMAGGGLAGLGYLLRLSLSPTEEDWHKTSWVNRSWLRDAVRRPFRLMKKYGSED
jgi:hypothetical protein